MTTPPDVAGETHVGDPLPTPRSSRLHRFAVVAWGPLLIVVTVVFAMRGFLFRPDLTTQHSDILTMWLPRYCFLGRSLAAGHIPLWNPYQFAGAPYASDAQSGWLYLPVSVLFARLPCGTALRMFIAFNPLLGSLSLYWFLRKEHLYRVAATAGAIAFGLVMASSSVVVSLPFAGALAWTPLVLVGASGWMRADRWPKRLLWLALGGLAWGQVAAAHMSHGLLLCSWLVFAYLVARAARAIHYRHQPALPAALMGLAFLAFLPLANLAILLPHLELVARTSLRGGYAALGGQLAEAAGVNDAPLTATGVWSGWPFTLAAAPGAFAGAVILLCIPLAVRTHGKRYLAAAFGAVAIGSWVLTLDALVTASWFRALVLRLPFGDVYLHNPGRFRYALFLVGPVLGALGIQGLIERPIKGRAVYAWLGAGLGCFLVLPMALGAHPARFGLFAMGALFAIPALVGLTRGRRWGVAAVMAVLVVELTASSIYSQAYHGGSALLGLEPSQEETAQVLRQPLTEEDVRTGPVRWPNVSEREYLAPGTIASRLQEQADRYLTWAPPAAYFEKGYLFAQDGRYWPALMNARGMLFSIPDVLGYSPIQLARYWSYIRATDPLPVYYNASVLQKPTLSDLRLLGVRWLIVPNTTRPTMPARKVMSEAGFSLYEVDGWEPRASVVTDWTVLPDPRNALARVLEGGFDPGTEAVVEQDPGLQPSPDAFPGEADYRETWPEDATITAHAEAPSLVVVRNVWDPGWSATVDGAPAPVLRANYLEQAVPIPAGDHVVRLTYRDPSIGRGALASAIAWAGWAIALAVSWLVAIRRRRRGGGAPPRSDA